MKFDSIESLKEEGFQGFIRFEDLIENCDAVDDKKGIYLVLYGGKGHPEFLERGTGGHLNDRDPNVSLETLKSGWIEDTIVIYIGQAGGVKGEKPSDETLQTRIATFMSFGRTNRVAHWGGRYIWQIRDRNDLILCWKTYDDKASDPKLIEGRIFKEFMRDHKGRLPFANLRE